MASCFWRSSIFAGTNSHVKLEIGYASASVAFVIEVRKSSGISFAVAAAAAVMLALSALANVPDEF